MAMRTETEIETMVYKVMREHFPLEVDDNESEG
jgi:hypothetical protein